MLEAVELRKGSRKGVNFITSELKGRGLFQAAEPVRQGHESVRESRSLEAGTDKEVLGSSKDRGVKRLRWRRRGRSPKLEMHIGLPWGSPSLSQHRVSFLSSCMAERSGAIQRCSD